MKMGRGKKVTLAYIFSFLTMFTFLFSQYVNDGAIGEFASKIDAMGIKYIFLFVSCVFFLMILYNRKDENKLFPNEKFLFEFKCYMKAIGVLFLISVVMQIFNGFNGFIISEFLYLITPILFITCLLSADSYNITRLLNALFYGTIVIFIVQNISKLGVGTLTSISFMNSYSPFESGLSCLMVFFELYFLGRNQKRKAIMSLLMSIITLKRISVLIGLTLFFLWPIFTKMLEKKKVLKKCIRVSIIIFCLLPFFLMYFYSENNEMKLSQITGIEFNQLTMDRFNRTSFVLKNRKKINQGLGSTTEFLTKSYGNLKKENRNLHSDILRIYIEGTFISTIAITFLYFKSVSKNKHSFIIMLIAFSDLIFNHTFLGAGNVGTWCIIYMLIFYFNNKDEYEFY